MRDQLLKSLILGSALLVPAAAQAQKAAAPPAQTVSQNEDEDDVVVTGQRPRGSVIGDIPAQNVLRSRDVKATGATSLDELLDAIAPQISAARQPGAPTP